MEEENNQENKIQQLGHELLKLIMNELNADKNGESDKSKEVICFVNQNMFRFLRRNKSCLVTIQLNLED